MEGHTLDLNCIIIYCIYFRYIVYKRVEYLFIRKKYIKEVVIDFQIKCDIFEADNMGPIITTYIPSVVLETMDCSPQRVFSLAVAYT